MCSFVSMFVGELPELVKSCSSDVEMSGNVFFNPTPSHSQWFIHIPGPRFSLVLFPFSSHSHWLFPLPPAFIPVLLVVSHQLTNDW